MDVRAATFSQRELCQITGLDTVTVDTWLIRGILETTKVDGRVLRGRRLFSVLAIFEAKVTADLVSGLAMPPSEASKVARCSVLLVDHHLLSLAKHIDGHFLELDALRGDLANHLCAHVLEFVVEFDLLGDGHTILGNTRCAKPTFAVRPIQWQTSEHPNITSSRARS